MPTTAPHYLLLTESDCNPHAPNQGGRWRFVLEPMNGDSDPRTSGENRIEVSEREADIWGERLQLLAVVRGVEALDQPSKLTLVTNSSLIGNRIRNGFDSWIEKEWRWENFGLLKPIKDADLWKRIHAATQIHSIECRVWQFSNRLAGTDWDVVEANNHWDRVDQSHPQVRKPFGPVEFEETSTRVKQTTIASVAADPIDEPRFVATRTGWARVTEIDPDHHEPIQYPQAFGATANTS